MLRAPTGRHLRIVAVLFFRVSTPSAEVDAAPSFSEVLGLQRAYSEAIRSLEYTGSIEKTSHSPVDGSVIYHDDAPRPLRRGYAGGQFYMAEEVQVPWGSELRQRTFDGREYMEAIPNRRQLNISSRPAEPQNQEYSVPIVLEPFLWSRGPDDPLTFSDRSESSHWDPRLYTVLSSSEVVRLGTPCVEYRFTRTPSLPWAREYHVSFAPALLYYPILTEMVQEDESGNGYVTTRIEVLETTAVESQGNRIVLPTRLRSTLYLNAETIVTEQQQWLNVDATLRLNQPVPPERFTLPRDMPGYRLFDVDRNILLPSVTTDAEWMDFMTRAGRPSGEIRVLGASEQPDPHMTASKPLLLGLGALVLLIGGLLLIVFKR